MPDCYTLVALFAFCLCLDFFGLILFWVITLLLCICLLHLRQHWSAANLNEQQVVKVMGFLFELLGLFLWLCRQLFAYRI